MHADPVEYKASTTMPLAPVSIQATQQERSSRTGTVSAKHLAFLVTSHPGARYAGSPFDTPKPISTVGHPRSRRFPFPKSTVSAVSDVGRLAQMPGRFSTHKKSRRHCCGPNTHAAREALTLVPSYTSIFPKQSGISSEYSREAVLLRLPRSGPPVIADVGVVERPQRGSSGIRIMYPTFIWPGLSQVDRPAAAVNRPSCWRGYRRARRSTQSPVGAQARSPHLHIRTRQDCARCAFQCPHLSVSINSGSGQKVGERDVLP